MDDQKRLVMLLDALELDNDSELITTIIENVGNVVVKDIGNVHNGYEVFMNPSGLTGKELENLQELFDVKEIGVYGDPDLPEDNVYFHMIVDI